MTSPSTTTPTADVPASSPLPAWLAKHAKVVFSADDVSALIDSIDSSQRPHESSLVHLPAELLLLVLEHVPIDHLLDWRLVCRGFRDAIDGRILYHHLQRTQLLGYMGAHEAYPMSQLPPESYERIRCMHANFRCIEKVNESGQLEAGHAIWNSPNAIFTIEDNWFEAFRNITGVEAMEDYERANSAWETTFRRLQLREPERGLATLRWCIKLDHEIFDLSMPLDKDHNSHEVDVRMNMGRIKVKWRNMLFEHFKTAAALRRMHEKVCVMSMSGFVRMLTPLVEKER